MYFQNTGLRHQFSKYRFLTAFAKLAVKYWPGR